MKKNLLVISTLAYVLIALKATAQVYIPGSLSQPIDKYSDTTTISFYQSINMQEEGFSLINPVVMTGYNTGYARSYNDGPIWRGNGLTTAFSSGFHFKKGKFSITLLPLIFQSQNKNYNRGNAPDPFSYQFSNRIDWVQQYGAGSFTSFHLGQSEIKYDFGRINLSVSTQNYSLGPAIYNPIILSRQAGGFPHARLELEPSIIRFKQKEIGKVEVNTMMGLLEESDFFDNNNENNERFFNLLSVGFAPSFIKGLKLTFNKALYKQTQYFENTDLLSSLYIVDNGVINGDTIGLNDTFDQLASLTMEYKIPEVGLRIYTEFAKNDFTSDGNGIRPTLVEPEHTRGFTLGVEKIFDTKIKYEIWFNLEHTNLSRSQTPWRPTPTFYAHGINRQGYTHNGQILGAGIGPGGNADNISVKAVSEKTTLGILLQRIEHNRDYFVDNVRNPNEHDVEYSVSGFFSRSLKKYDLFGELTFSHNYNKYYLDDDSNLAINLGCRVKVFSNPSN